MHGYSTTLTRILFTSVYVIDTYSLRISFLVYIRPKNAQGLELNTKQTTGEYFGIIDPHSKENICKS